ncbi:MAG: hypothetical protein CMM47_03240 [Rhodospirillaceae bacterium]|nr:hypothetical protein [Rhodospirillaceae bacterium]
MMSPDQTISQWPRLNEYILYNNAIMIIYNIKYPYIFICTILFSFFLYIGLNIAILIKISGITRKIEPEVIR